MRLIGLTGGIGMGKSTVAEFLALRGERVVDTDVLARQLVEPGQEALVEIQRVFGDQVLSPDGRLDRKALARAVFSAPDLRKKLEAILHPRIRTTWQELAGRWRKEGLPRGFVVIPLLYETGAEAELDTVWCVACSREAQQERLRARGWNDGEIAQRNGAQLPVAAKMDRAGGVIWNNGSIEVCLEQCRRLLLEQ